MSNNREQYWDDEDDDFEDTPSYESETDLVKKLRKQVRIADKKYKELETSYNELSKSQKERVIKDVLTSKGVNPVLADMIPASVEITPDAISAWVDTLTGALGIKKDEKPAVPQQDITAMQRMEQALEGADASTLDQAESIIANATSEEDILSLIRSAN